MVVYISGPMTGIEEFNFPAFICAKKLLEEDGNTVLSPHEAPKADSWEGYMRHDIRLVTMSDVICMLPGWKKSRGALLEKCIADALGMPAWFICEDGKTINKPDGFIA